MNTRKCEKGEGWFEESERHKQASVTIPKESESEPFVIKESESGTPRGEIEKNASGAVLDVRWLHPAEIPRGAGAEQKESTDWQVFKKNMSIKFDYMNKRLTGFSNDFFILAKFDSRMPNWQVFKESFT